MLLGVISQESPQTPHVNVMREDAEPLPLSPAGLMLRRHMEAFHIMKLQWPSTWPLRTWPLAPLLLFCASLLGRSLVWEAGSFPASQPASAASQITATCHQLSSWRHFTRLSLKGTLPPTTLCLSQNKACAPRRACGNLSPPVILLLWQSPGDLPSRMKTRLQVINAGN